MNRRRPILAAAVSAAILLLGGAGHAWAQQTPRGAPAEEAPLTVHVAGVPDTVLTTLYGENLSFIPLLALFQHLQIDVSLDSVSDRLSGHYISSDRPFSVDLRRRMARVDGKTLRVDSLEFVHWQQDVYVAPSLLTRIFGIQVSIDLPSLSIIVASADTFPIAMAGVRQFQRERQMAERRGDLPAPLEYARSPKLLNGLMLNYEITGQASAATAGGLLDLHSGGEVLGGDFQATLHAGSGRGVTAGAAIWHYVVDAPHRLLTQITAGSLSSTGLRGVPMHRVQLTNEPVQRRALLGDHLLTGMTHPEWEVELYLGDQLIAYTRADLSGHYSFDLPLPYGSSLLSVKTYGPTGGQEQEQRRLEVPLTLVPVGQLDYTVSLGRNTQDGGGLAQSRFSYGLRQRVTAFVGNDYLGKGTAGRGVLFAGATTRILSSLIGSAATAPGALNQASLFFSSPSQAHVQFTYTGYAAETPYNRLNVDRQLQFETAVPLDLHAFDATFYAYGGSMRFIGSGTTYDLNAQAMLNLGAAKPSLRVRRSIFAQPGRDISLTNEVTAGLLYFFRSTRRLRPLYGTLLSASADYRPDQRKLQRIETALSRTLPRNGRLTAGYNWSAVTRTGQVQLRYIYDLPSIQTMSTVQSGAMSGSSFAQTLRGTATLDPTSGGLTFSGREGVGRAGAVFRFFVDANGDGIWEKGEETVSGARIRFHQAAALELLKDGRVRVSDLLPYLRYSVDVDESGVQNPLWRPKFSDFSFIADPNSFKVIDVPFYAAAEVEGSIMETVGGAPREMGGITVRLRRTDRPEEFTVTTFGDGTFYHPGLSPGTYVIEPDATQLRKLNVTARPALRTLEVLRGAQGVTVSGIDFLLERLPPPQPEATTTPAPPIPPSLVPQPTH